MIHSACEYLLYARKNGIREADITFIPAKVFSPYMECLPTAINQIALKESRTIEVNPFFHYEEIFSELLTAENEEILPELKNFIFDFWIHEVFELERLAGMTRKSFEKSCFINEIMEGVFGGKTTWDFGLFCEEEQDVLMNQVLRLYSGGDGSVLFGDALKLIFSDIYVYLLDDRKILLYIGEKESSVLKKQIYFLKDIFLPIGIEMDIFWNQHFGVFGVDETMVLDKIALV